MEKITKEVFETVKAKSRMGLSTPLRTALEEVLIEEGLLLKKEEWPFKTDPSAYVHQLFREPRSTKKFQAKTLDGERGWVFLRIK